MSRSRGWGQAASVLTVTVPTPQPLDLVVVATERPSVELAKRSVSWLISVRADPQLSLVTPWSHGPETDRLRCRLGCLPDAELPATELPAGGHRWLPDIQPPTPDGPAGVGGHPSADLIDHQPRPQRHHPGIDRDGLPRARRAGGRDPPARMAAHLEDAKLGPAGAGCARRRARGGRPGRTWWRGRGRVRGTAGHHEDSTSDRPEQRNGCRPPAASVASTDRHVLVLCSG
jgi:hypothetical protein